LVIDVRAPEATLGAALAEVKTLLVRMPTTASDADLARATAARDRAREQARADPRQRLVDGWVGRRAGPPPRIALPAFRAFLAAAIHESAIAVVEAR
jgi:hypothetical protein